VPAADKRGWLQRLGLRSAPPDPEEWVEVADGGVDSAVGSHVVAELVQQLTELGIDAQEKSYVAPDGAFNLSGGPDAQSRLRFAVMVHRRDQPRASEFLRSHQAQPVSDAELTRQAEAAGDAQIPADER
jgi:hypothetical protein